MNSPSSVGETVTCPTCESDEITYDGWLDCGSIDVRCEDCGSRWCELWQFTGIAMIEGEDNREVES